MLLVGVMNGQSSLGARSRQARTSPLRRAPLAGLWYALGVSVRARELALAAAVALTGCGDGGVRPLAGVLEVRPARLELGTFPLAQPARRTVVLANVGDAPLTWRATVEPEGALSLTPAEGPLAGGQAAAATLLVHPRAPGPLSATVRFTTDSPETPSRTLAVTASVAPQVLTLTPAPVSFGPVRLGLRSAREVRLTSHSAAPVTLSLALSAPDPGFEGPTTTSLSIPAGGSQVIPLAFAPTRPGVARARLEVSGACPGCAVSAALSAEGVPASLVCSPTAVEFGYANPGAAVTRRLSCTNVSPEPIVLRSAAVDPEAGPFSADPPVLPRTLPPAGVLAMDVTFRPTARTRQSALLSWELLEGDVGLTHSGVPLTGRGGGPDLQVSTALLYFGGAVAGAPASRTLTLRNAGDAPLALQGAQVTPAAAGFAVQADLPTQLQPGASSTLPLAFDPPAPGESQASLRLLSDDPDQPRLEVGLEGVGLAPGQCTARLSPEAASFGLVRVGGQVTVELVLSAGADAACAWFDPRVSGDDSFTFEVTPPRSGVLGPAQRRVFPIRYAPRAPSPEAGHQATFSVDVPHAPGRTPTAPLLGVAADSDLVVFPEEVDFGVRPVGARANRTVFIHNTGAELHTLTDVGVLGAAPGLGVAAPPLPVILRPGEATQVELTYAPASPGELRTQVSLHTDRLPAAVRVSVSAVAVDVDCARVQGELCLPAGMGPVMGAEVTVTAADGGRTVTTTDEGGRFLSACLSPGAALVEARRGHYSARGSVVAAAGRTVTLPGPTCLAPPAASRILVVTGAYDRVEDTLARLGMAHVSVPGVLDTAEALLDPALADRADLVFVNCGARDTRRPDVAENLRRFVGAGGSLYVSDLAYDLVEAAFPEALALAGDDGAQDAAEVGRVLSFPAQLLAPELLRGLGQGRLTVALDGDYAVVEAAGPGAELLAVGPTAGPSQGLAPVVVRYRPGPQAGVVLYTTLHDSAAVADPKVRQLLALLILAL